MDITLGLDFGTHQSKLCLTYTLNNDRVVEFVPFTKPNGGKTYLFPSFVQLNEDGTLSYGWAGDKLPKRIRMPKPQMKSVPPEPVEKCPPKPKLVLPPKPANKSGVMTSLSDLKAGLSASVVDKMSAWKAECEKIQMEHEIEMDDWQIEMDGIRQRHEDWERQAESIRNENRLAEERWASHGYVDQKYRYFKTASLTNTFTWDRDQYELDSDHICVWYLTDILLYIKEYVYQRFSAIFEEDVFVQMGAPSGLNDQISSQIENHARKLLAASRELATYFGSLDEFWGMDVSELISLTEIPKAMSRKDAEEQGIKIIPEAYAGLSSLTQERRLTRGKMHLLVDIGGGTTDIAFFTISRDLDPDVHAVISMTKGVNYVLEDYCNREPAVSLAQAQDSFLLDRTGFEPSMQAYQLALQRRLNDMIHGITKTFLETMNGTRATSKMLVNAMKGCPIVYIGGGSLYGGMKTIFPPFDDLISMNADLLNIRSLVNKDIQDEIVPIMATSYGLAIPRLDDEIRTDMTSLFSQIATQLASDHNHGNHHLDYGLLDD